MATPVQKARILALYKNSMKTLLDWAVSRDVFYVQVRRPARATATEGAPPAAR